MKMATREDISAPIEAVFEQTTDFDHFERAAIRRGAEVQRTDSLAEVGVGSSWHAAFGYRGKKREAEIEMTELQTPERVAALIRSAGLEMRLEIDLIAMSRNRTRLNLTIDARPKTIPARLMIQSMKLARTSVLKRFRHRVGDFAEELERRANGRA